ncbi:MAG: hypothetical protein ABI690_19570 [Chloroflexota bacterium]
MTKPPSNITAVAPTSTSLNGQRRLWPSRCDETDFILAVEACHWIEAAIKDKAEKQPSVEATSSGNRRHNVNPGHGA